MAIEGVAQEKLRDSKPGGGTARQIGLLADEENIYGAQIEVVVEWQSGEPIIGGVLAGVELHRYCRQWESKAATAKAQRVVKGDGGAAGDNRP